MRKSPFFTLILALPLLAVILTLPSCESPTTGMEKFAGSFEERKHINETLGFALDIPDTWRIVSGEELRQRQAASAEELRSKISDIGTRQSAFEPFMALEPYATSDSSYVTILFMAESLGAIQGINNAYDYFNQNAAILQSQDPNAFPRYEFTEVRQSRVAEKSALSQGTMIHPSADEIQPMETTAIRRGEHLLVFQIANFDSLEELNLAKSLLDQMQWMQN